MDKDIDTAVHLLVRYCCRNVQSVIASAVSANTAQKKHKGRAQLNFDLTGERALAASRVVDGCLRVLERRAMCVSRSDYFHDVQHNTRSAVSYHRHDLLY